MNQYNINTMTFFHLMGTCTSSPGIPGGVFFTNETVMGGFRPCIHGWAFSADGRFSPIRAFSAHSGGIRPDGRIIKGMFGTATGPFIPYLLAFGPFRSWF